MADTVTLDDMKTDLIFEAGIDGKSGSNARHTPTALNRLLNRCYKDIRGIAAQNGEEALRTPGTAATLPARASGEDWIEVDYPTAAAEIIAIDVRLGGQWYDLTKSSWAQRRVYPGENRCDSPGEWSVISQPQPSTTTVTVGKIAIWPYTLSGTYKIDILPHWVPITDGTHVFVVYPHWQEWILTKAAMVVIGRDNNKRGTFAAAKLRNEAAEAKIIAQARRSKRGVVVQRRRDNMEL